MKTTPSSNDNPHPPMMPHSRPGTGESRKALIKRQKPAQTPFDMTKLGAALLKQKGREMKSTATPVDLCTPPTPKTVPVPTKVVDLCSSTPTKPTASGSASKAETSIVAKKADAIDLCSSPLAKNAATTAAEILGRITSGKSNLEIMGELYQLVGTPAPSIEELTRICRADRSSLVPYEQYLRDISKLILRFVKQKRTPDEVVQELREIRKLQTAADRKLEQQSHRLENLGMHGGWTSNFGPITMRNHLIVGSFSPITETAKQTDSKN
eukprot:scaffold3046_cov71-Cyclotella_meneghiniana.AAC.1